MSHSSPLPTTPEKHTHDHGDHAHDHHSHAPAKPLKKAAPPAIGCGACCGGDTHAHDDGDDHAGHDHSALPGWPRIYAALAVALGAEVAHWFQYEYVGMALAGLGGVVAAPVTAANTGIAVSILVPALIVTVIGGMGSIAGAALGAVIVAVIEVLGAAFLPRFGGVLIYAALAAALIWRPEGLLHPRGAR